MPGFSVDRDYQRIEVDPATNMRAEAHKALDELMDKVQREGGGGESVLEGTCPEGHRHAFRLTFCDFSNQTICVFCNGTGVEGS